MPDPLTRVPLPDDELYILKHAALTPQICDELIAFNIAYQHRVLAQFLKFRRDWEAAYPGKTFPGLSAEVNSITGQMRPLDQQHAWSWGDARGLGIWAYFLLKGRVPDDMKQAFEDYCDLLYRSLLDRCEACGGGLPFMVDIETNRPADDPRNLVTRPGSITASDIFAITAMFQYGLLRGEPEAFGLGSELLERCVWAARTGNYSTGEPGHRFQGSPMVTVGALVDVLKGIEVRGGHDALKADLIRHARDMIDYILSNHYDPDTHDFWEENGPDGRPWTNDDGQQICDPGHTAEACGFFAELCGFLPEDDGRQPWSRDAILAAILEMNDLVTRHGFSPRGVMFKNIDLRTKQGVPDTSGGGAAANRPTAPWWNIREHAAASLKLYQLTADPRCLEGYRKSHNAAYLHYPNARNGGLMVQTLDPFTLQPLDIHPATGNLDPMHSPRAREREIEALQLIRPQLT